MKFALVGVALILLIAVFGFIPLWSHTNIFGAERINSYEFFMNCWQGDVRICNYNFFD